MSASITLIHHYGAIQGIFELEFVSMSMDVKLAQTNYGIYMYVKYIYINVKICVKICLNQMKIFAKVRSIYIMQ